MIAFWYLVVALHAGGGVVIVPKDDLQLCMWSLAQVMHNESPRAVYCVHAREV